MTRFYIDGKWIELDELIEKAKKWDFVRPAQMNTIIELNDKLEAIKTSLDEWITSDGTLESIIGIVEKILEEERKNGKT